MKILNINLKKIYKIIYIKYNDQKIIYLIKIILINKLIFKVLKKKIWQIHKIFNFNKVKIFKIKK